MLCRFAQKIIPHGSSTLSRLMCTANDESETAIFADKLKDFFKRADDNISEQKVSQDERSTMESTPEPELSSAMNEKPGEIYQKNTSGDLPRPTAVAFVPWTLNRMLQEPNIRKLRARHEPTSDQSFSKLLRYSPFVQLGDFQHREVIGVVIENVNDTDLYIDFGGKFHCVCQQPANQFYPRGSLVRIRLRDPEMTNKFMINTKGISLCEADATLLGPYRGKLVTAEKDTVSSVSGDNLSTLRPATEFDNVCVDNFQLI